MIQDEAISENDAIITELKIINTNVFRFNVIYLMWRVYVTRRCNPSCVLIAESDSAIRKVKQVRAVSVYIHVYTYIKRRPSIRSIKINENSSTLSQRGKNDRRVIIVRSCLFENFIKAINIYIYRVYEILKFYQKSNWINPYIFIIRSKETPYISICYLIW